MLGYRLLEEDRHGRVPHGRYGLGRCEHRMPADDHDLLVHGDHAAAGVDVVQCKGECLALPQPGARGGGSWHRLLDDALESPAVMLRNLLWWAVVHDERDRVALLAVHGVDIESPLSEQRAGLAGHHTPAEEALINSHPELAAQLFALGAGAPRLSPPDAFVAAALAGDADEVARTDPAVIAAVRQARPGLVTWAASQSAPDAVELLVRAGFDVNSFGRSDVRCSQLVPEWLFCAR